MGTNSIFTAPLIFPECRLDIFANQIGVAELFGDVET